MTRLFAKGAIALIFIGQLAGQDDPRLKRFLEKFPKSDLNGDGTLTLKEAQEFRAKMRRAQPKKPDRPAQTGERLSADELAQRFEACETQDGLLYRLFTPKIEANARYPLILSLHGAGGKGNDNLKSLKPWNGLISEPEFQAKHPCFIVVPQSPGPWRVQGSEPDITPEDIAGYPEIWREVAKIRAGMFLNKATDGKLGPVFALLDKLAGEMPIDVDRVYVLGHSMGGFGSFECLAAEPNRFAAAIPSAGGLSPWHDPVIFKHVPIWAFHGDQDRTVLYGLSLNVFERLREAGGAMKLTKLGGVGHGASGYAFSYTGDAVQEGFETLYTGENCDRTEDVWEWLFARKRSER